MEIVKQLRNFLFLSFLYIFFSFKMYLLHFFISAPFMQLDAANFFLKLRMRNWNSITFES